MAAFEMPEPTRLLMAGDWHKNAMWVQRLVDHAKRNDCDAILQLGDFGYWPAWDEYTQSQTGGCYFTNKVKGYAKDAGIPIYWLDGNHENHEALEPGQGGQWLRHLPRGHRWGWWGKTWMAVGGGVSVDANARTPGYDWFPDEVLSMTEYEHCMRDGHVDIIVAHDCPNKVEIPGVHGQGKTNDPHGWFDPALIARSEENRALMGTICDDKKPSHWFHGHYHERYNAQRGDTMIVGLDKDNSHYERNSVILTVKDLDGHPE